MSQQLNTIRRKIDDIDRELLHLLNERAKLARELGVIKRARGLTIQDHVRENDILARVREKNRGPLKADNAVKIFETIIRECRGLQETETKVISLSDSAANRPASISLNHRERKVRSRAARSVRSGA